MAKVYTTINANYRPNWNKSHGIREYLQNAKDAETQYLARMNVFHKNNTLFIENIGSTMSREDLLLGTSSKVGNSQLIGQFGDGLKIGTLALVRDGLSVKIRNGSEIWIPSIERSDKFQANVLAFNITDSKNFENRVSIEVKGIGYTDYKQICENFLWLADKKSLNADSVVKTDYGDLLLADCYKGKLFVKGIFVQYDEKLDYGYNLSDAETDIERRIVNYYDKNYAISRIWNAAINTRPDLFEKFFDMLDLGSQDLEGINEYSVSNMSDDVKTKVVDRFKYRNGNDAIPVASLSESKEAAHLGKTGIITNKALNSILTNKMGNFAVVKNTLRQETINFYSWNQLESSEHQVIDFTIQLMSKVNDKVSIDDIDIVDFRDDSLMGLFKDGRIQIARKLTVDKIQFMRTYIHELAHKITMAPDGDKRHVACIEEMWAKLWSQSYN